MTVACKNQQFNKQKAKFSSSFRENLYVNDRLDKGEKS